MHNINLIGYRCSGKSAVGRQLAKELQRPFVDADSFFSEQEKMSVTEFVAKSGWGAFRRVESRILTLLCRQDKIVLATGGGVVLSPDNRSLLRESGFNIWLRVQPETVLARMAADPESGRQRPPLGNLSPAAEIAAGLREREPYYRETGDCEIPVERLSIIEIVSEIMLKYRRGRR